MKPMHVSLTDPLKSSVSQDTLEKPGIQEGFPTFVLFNLYILENDLNPKYSAISMQDNFSKGCFFLKARTWVFMKSWYLPSSIIIYSRWFGWRSREGKAHGGLVTQSVSRTGGGDVPHVSLMSFIAAIFQCFAVIPFREGGIRGLIPRLSMMILQEKKVMVSILILHTLLCSLFCYLDRAPGS